MNASGDRVTIKDVAARAGVSKGAVSLAFNHKPRVSQATRERIFEAARELGWAPSATARSLSGRRVDIVGPALRRPARLLGLEPFSMGFVFGIESVLADRSSSLLLRLVRDLDEEAAVYKEWWRGRMIAGAILVDFREDDPRVPALRGLGLPAVAVGHPSLTGPFPWCGRTTRRRSPRPCGVWRPSATGVSPASAGRPTWGTAPSGGLPLHDQPRYPTPSCCAVDMMASWFSCRPPVRRWPGTACPLRRRRPPPRPVRRRTRPP